jgi:hypothetical protein
MEPAAIASSGGRVRLFTRLLVVGMASAVVLLLPFSAGAAPVPDSQFVQFTLVTNGGPSVFFVGPGGFLPGSTCPFAPAGGAGAQLTADVHGWETPVLDPQLGTRDVSFHANLGGTVTDTGGNVYHLTGNFTESGVTAFPDYFVPFDGFGRLTISGPAGVVTGDAEFRAVTAGPPEWDFTFSAIQVCNIH